MTQGRGSGTRARDGTLVARNTLLLVAAQVATAALSFGVTALLARSIGAGDYGVFYLAATLVRAAFVLVDFGQEYHVVRTVANSPDRLAAVLGSGLALRVLGGLMTYPVVTGAVAMLGYADTTVTAVSLTVIFFVFSSFTDGAGLVLRGLERMDVEAALRVAAKTAIAVAIALAVIAEGGLVAVLQGQIIGGVVGAVIYLVALRHLGMPRPRADMQTAWTLVAGGAPFLLWNIAITVHPSLDAAILSKLASADEVGWYGAAWRLVGILIFPATLLSAALYPTLSRLHARDADGYAALVRSALRATVLFGTLSAVGTYLFADELVALVYGVEDFAPAASILSVLAGYLALVFVDITLGVVVMAANAQTSWIIAKIGSVVLAVCLNLVLVPACQATLANGGVGIAASNVVTEIVMFAVTLYLIPLPRPTIVLALAKDFARAAVAAAAMAVVAFTMGNAEPAAAVGAAVVAYLLGSVLVGNIRRADIGFVRNAMKLRSDPQA
jgi:O-antigen/teichoic acid export membrane protein